MAAVTAIALTLSPNGRTQATGSSKSSSAAVVRGQVIPAVVPSSSLKVALITAESQSAWVSDVQAKLQATGKFSQVDIIAANSTTPTVAQLQAYESVLVWSDNTFADPTALGNNLADYVDGGGGVVVAVFANIDDSPIGGRFASDDYYALEPAYAAAGPELTLGTVYNPSSPLMAGVSSLDGGASSYRSTGSINANAVRVADWSNGDPLVITRTINGVRRVDLNFFPPSSDARSDFWKSSTDGTTLMANALEFVVAPKCTSAPVGMSHWWPGEGDANDIVGHNDGTLHNGASFGAGEVHQAFNFDGNNDQYIDVGQINFGNAFSFDAWINPAETTSQPIIFAQYDGGNGFAVYTNSGRVRTFIANGSSYTESDTADAVLTNGTWQHVAVTFQGSAGFGQKFIIYINGAAVATTVVGDGTSTVGASSVAGRIGDYYGGEPWTGQIDEVQFFDRVLTANEVAGIANAGSAGVCRSCASAPASLLGWWKADGNATDSQNSFDGVLNGTVPFAAGKVGQAFSFDGNAPNFVLVPPNASLDLAQWTVDAWVYPTTSTGIRFIVDKGAHNLGENYLLSLEDGNFVEVDFNNGTGGHQFVDSTIAVPVNAWSHLAGTYDGNTLALYINGGSAGTFVSGQDPRGPNPVTQALKIGGRNNPPDPSFPFQGLIDEVEVFDRGLTQREVQTIYDALDGGKCPCVEAPSGMIAWWAGNDSAADIQGPHDATLDGAGFGPGEVNHAFTFNGTSDKVNLPASDDWNFGSGGFTVDFWARSNGSSNAKMYTVSFEPDTTFQTRNLDFDFNDSYGLWVFWNGGGNPGIRVGNVGAYTDGQWHHFTLAKIGSTFTLYIDGAPAGTLDDSGAMNLSGGSNNFIGAATFRDGNNNEFITNYWNGSIDEVEVFNRGLSADEVAGIYHAGGAGKCRPYHTVAVSSGGGGTATGGTTVRQGTPVEVSATADGCDTFAGWFENNQLVSSANPYDFTVKGANRNLVAKFNKIQYQIAATASPAAGGTVTGAGPYNCGATATLTATAANGYSFVNWTEGGNQVSTSAPYSFTVSGNRTLVANFKQNSHLGTASGSGTISNQHNRPSFSFSISNNNRTATPSGTLTYTDTNFHIKLTSTAITAISLVNNQATFSGKGTMPGSNPRKPVQVTFTVVATDNGVGPRDTINIQISPTYSATGNLTSGDIVVH